MNVSDDDVDDDVRASVKAALGHAAAASDAEVSSSLSHAAAASDAEVSSSLGHAGVYQFSHSYRARLTWLFIPPGRISPLCSMHTERG